MKHIKMVNSPEYNYVFNRNTGFFARWGKTRDHDPDFSPYGPEIADIEITTICKGPGGIPCPFCYKSNTPKGENMSFETFKRVFFNLPTNLTQIAFGVDAQCESNPDTFKIMEFCREHNIVPNVTVADISDEVADKLSNLCGAVAVSRYKNKEFCYNSIKKLTDRGMNQINIHILVSKETLPWIYETIEDVKKDDRLKGLNAIVFLSLKQKGRGVGFTPVSKEDFKKIVDTCFENKIGFGFDSCSAPKFINSVKDRDNFSQLEMACEPCESTLFSVYVNEKGQFFPCSFSEGQGEWKEGIDLTISEMDFMKDVWNNEKVLNFRNNLLKNKDVNGIRKCPIYEV